MNIFNQKEFMWELFLERTRSRINNFKISSVWLVALTKKNNQKNGTWLFCGTSVSSDWT